TFKEAFGRRSMILRLIMKTSNILNIRDNIYLEEIEGTLHQ
ncbi:hypothetical protein D1BOALGB6SA_7485, partial [Olavius sp. associated proteobacterium Delta 1]